MQQQQKGMRWKGSVGEKRVWGGRQRKERRGWGTSGGVNEMCDETLACDSVRLLKRIQEGGTKRLEACRAGGGTEAVFGGRCYSTAHFQTSAAALRTFEKLRRTLAASLLARCDGAAPISCHGALLRRTPCRSFALHVGRRWLPTAGVIQNVWCDRHMCAQLAQCQLFQPAHPNCQDCPHRQPSATALFSQQEFNGMPCGAGIPTYPVTSLSVNGSYALPTIPSVEQSAVGRHTGNLFYVFLLQIVSLRSWW